MKSRFDRKAPISHKTAEKSRINTIESHQKIIHSELYMAVIKH